MTVGTQGRYRGRDFVVQLANIGGTSGAFTTLGGLRTNKLTINNNPVDVSDDSSGWRKLLPDAGVQSVDVSGDGILANDTYLSLLHGAAIGRTALNLKLTDGKGDSYIGDFVISSFERSGSHDGAETYSISLQSDGPLVFTAG